MIRLYAYTLSVGMYSLGGIGRPFELETLPLDTNELVEAVNTWKEFLGADYVVNAQVVSEASLVGERLDIDTVLDDIREFLKNG